MTRAASTPRIHPASGMWLELKQDVARYDRAWRHPGLWVCASYRMRRLRKLGGWWWMLLPADLLLDLLRHFVSDVRLPSVVPIGGGLYLPHPHGIFINHQVRIGRGCTLFNHVTLGEWKQGAPVIEDNVTIFPGARLFGAINIGANSMVGANAVVSRNMPGGHVIAGNPATVLRRLDAAEETS